MTKVTYTSADVDHAPFHAALGRVRGSLGQDYASWIGDTRAAGNGLPLVDVTPIDTRVQLGRFAGLMSLEVGKNRLEAMGDAEESADLIDYYCPQLEDAAGFVREMARVTPAERNVDVLRPYAVAAVSNFDAAIARANAVEYGLTAGIFTADTREIERFFDEGEAGVCYANRRAGATTGAWPGAQSFTGWKASGSTGKGGCGPNYLSQFMREQSRTVVAS